MSSSVTMVSGSGISTFSSSASRTASRAAAACSRRRAAAEPLAHVLGQLGDGVELRGQLGELVVELGQLLLLHLGDGDRDVDVLADQVAADELGGEDLLVAGGHADQRLVETVDHAAAADAVGHAGDLGAVDDLAVLGGLEVHDHEVAVGGRALDVDQGGEPLTQRLDLLGRRPRR